MAKTDADHETVQKAISSPYQGNYQIFHNLFPNLHKRPESGTFTLKL
jgi:hypothetical protein